MEDDLNICFNYVLAKLRMWVEKSGKKLAPNLYMVKCWDEFEAKAKTDPRGFLENTYWFWKDDFTVSTKEKEILNERTL